MLWTYNTAYTVPAQNARCERELAAAKATNDTK